MSVSRLDLLVILGPLHNPAAFADPCRCQALPAECNLLHQLRNAVYIGNAAALRCFLSQCLPRLKTACEKMSEDLVVHCRPDTAGAGLPVRQPVGIFRRDRRACHKITVSLNQEVHKEQRCLGKHRECSRQELPVLRVEVVCPEMRRKPCRPHCPVRAGIPDVLRRGIAVDVRVMVGNVAPAAVHFACSSASRPLHLFQQVKQGQMAFRQVTAFHMPVVHLRIDIDCIFAVPRRSKVLVPQALQGSRKSVRTAAGDRQVSAEVKQQLTQPDIRSSLLRLRQTLICRTGVIVLCAVQFKGKAVVQRSVIRDVLQTQLFKRLLRRLKSLCQPVMEKRL